MKRCCNLLPASSQRQFEHRRQARFWSAVGLTTAGVLASGFALLTAQTRNAQRELLAAQEAIAPLIQAVADTQRLQAETESHRRLVTTCRALEQTDTPLALMQVLSECCRDLGDQFRLDSLRMDELTTVAQRDGQPVPPEKQLVLAGTADSDAGVTTFVGRLRASQLFQRVELESSQALAEHAAAARSFQIRCQR